MNENYKLVMIIDGDKEIIVKDNINCVFANQLKLLREYSESRDNVEYRIIEKVQS